ncbi:MULTISPECIES: autotransporter outer membrane beta-barrel domain-containing protein [unclassified Pseudomonas]|uniref:autotransporter outer membrane beta-barrel domain-containing protein n=1 Tax=unclassified Pseudomonas TaxID=196821 RepID=UPI000871653B|nr:MULTISPECIES: autotransporter outer membrane beta-barrel domain-containing protein [unclassified Pseudomonas]SCW94881.1 outer membrane autotransporter barrel domain-containing protein [Pseudomonas sp. NFACC05-1]SFL27789.1 outer membrane autotransporter barrel domain-containing protein [Pseudomonas sp. NFACC46-3]
MIFSNRTFALNPISRCLALASVAPFIMVCQFTQARTLTDEDLTIGAGGRPDNYQLFGNSTLTANGASTQDIQVAIGGTVNLNGTTVTGGSSNGVQLVDSAANIAANSTVTSNGIALALTGNVLGAKATVTDSSLIGGTRGASLSAASELTLSNATVTATGATGTGIVSFGGTVQASNNTRITGGQNGVVLRNDISSVKGNQLTLDASHVEGLNGAAIVVSSVAGLPDREAVIDVSNGSTLKGSDGVMLQVTNDGMAALNVDNSVLLGDVVAEAGSIAKVALSNFATLTGRLENVDTLAVNSSGKWVMVEDSQLKNLSMAGGEVQFGQPGSFYTLSVENLSGNGNFIMHADFSNGQADFLNITGTATGTHTLDVASTGVEPTLANQRIHVVHAASGDAAFSLINGRVDLGTYSYDLLKDGANDWYLDGASKTISPGTASVLALFDASRTVWYGELSTLRSRMGEVRMNQGQSGGWMRAYGNRFDVSADSGMAYRQTQQGLAFGVDTPVPSVGDGQWVFGLMGGYSRSDLDLIHGTSGTVNSFYVGSYATWLDAESGYYFDGVLKFNRFQNESKVSLSDGAQAKGRYNTHGLGTTLEFGRHIKLDDGYFIEPFGQVSALAVQGKRYQLDNGMAADGNRSYSLLGKVGASAGRDIDLGNGQMLQPYVKAALVNEFAKDNQVKVNSTSFNNDLSGSRLELGGGVAMKVADKVQVHADVDYSQGKKIDQPWGVNFGVEYKF